MVVWSQYKKPNEILRDFWMRFLITPYNTTTNGIQFFITSLLEVPGVLLSGPILKRFGRKYPCIVCHFMWAISAITFAFVKGPTALNIMNHISKLLIVVTYSIIWLYTPELFPTRCRGFAIGITTSFAKLASIFSAFFEPLLNRNRTVLMLTLAACSLSISFLTIFLPDTNENMMTELSDMKPLRQCARLRQPKNHTNTNEDDNNDLN
ncbi:hypothetical protein ACOME3_001927 [Neoechinorhynchus agilis]